MANPLVPQGTLNRLRANLLWEDFPELNITAPFLGEAGISITLQGDSVTYIPTLTGAVASPEPYMVAEIAANLLKSQALADAYKTQIEAFALLGACTVRGDARLLSPYSFINCTIETPSQLTFNGKDAGYIIRVKGYYNINANLWNL